MEQDARLVIERYFLEPGEAVGKIKVLGGEYAIVGAGSSEWVVRAMTKAQAFTKSEGYALYAVAPFGAYHTREKGVAVLPDESTFRLDDERDFLAFYARAHGLLDPVELAALLSFYQSKADRPEGVIVQQEDLAEVISASDLASLPGPLLPEAQRGEHGELTLSFCTQAMRRDRGFRIDVYRWQVHADARAKLTWSTTALARGLKFLLDADRG
jgi:hypothetical protein